MEFFSNCLIIFFAVYCQERNREICVDNVAWLLIFKSIFSHWYYTIVGNAENKIIYFADAIKLFKDDIRYIQDLYHVVLHCLSLHCLY